MVGVCWADIAAAHSRNATEDVRSGMSLIKPHRVGAGSSVLGVSVARIGGKIVMLIAVIGSGNV